MSKGNFLIKLDESDYNKQLQVSKGGVEQAANALYNKVLDGEVSAIQTAEMIKFVSEVAAKVKDMTDENGKNAFTELVRGEIQASAPDGKKYTSKYGTTLELAETGVRYVFEKCGDPLWNYYNSQMSKIKALKEQREKFLKTITVPYPAGNVVIPDTGEIIENITLYPPIKTSTSSYIQTLLDD